MDKVHEIEYYENGNKKSETIYGETSYTKKIITYYENGNKYSEKMYHNDEKLCEYRYYYENEQLQREGNDNEETSKETNYIDYYENGNKKKERKKIIHAEKDCVKKYYENGILMCEYNCRNTPYSMQGLLTSFHNSENLKDYYHKHDTSGNIIKKFLIIKDEKYILEEPCLFYEKPKVMYRDYYGNGYDKKCIHTKFTYKNKIVFFY